MDSQDTKETLIKRITENHDVKIFTKNIEEEALRQIETLLAIGTFRDCKIRIMPDVHAGAGCVIGFTGNLGDKVIPNIVGVDIGCGILVQPFSCMGTIDFHALNAFILSAIPSGRNFRGENYKPLPHTYMEMYSEAKEIIKQLRCYRELKETKRLNKAIGTLGGGNHFIELDKDEIGFVYLVVHTGSRNLGKQVAQIYQKLALKCQSGWATLMEKQTEMIEAYKRAGRKSELQEAIRNLHNSFKMYKPSIPAELSYLEKEFREDYLHDMRLCQQWAKINRCMIAELIMDYLLSQRNVEGTLPMFESVHNYISDDNLIRKGAISARAGEKCIIPLNMRDGSLICIGKGNKDWNESAPHGAGRVMSRSQAFANIRMEEYLHSMEGIYSESVVESTKDESPMVYKPKAEIIRNIQDTVTVVNTITPIYNFKAVG